MRWLRILNVRTVRLLILTGIIGALLVYDYDYISQIYAYKEQSNDISLLQDISLNNEVKLYSHLQPVSRSQAVSDTETVNVSTGDSSRSSSYVRAIEEIMSGEMTPATHIRSQSDRHINLGLILINLGNTTELSDKFTKKVNKGRISFVDINNVWNYGATTYKSK